MAAWPGLAHALPQYAVQSGRTCGNCHVSPTYEDRAGWENPELALRKCNMSCIACHVSPSGGGLRNSSGRYYGQSSLSIVPLQERSYSDHGRELLSYADTRLLLDWLVEPLTATVSHGKPRRIPSSALEVERHIGAGASGGRTSFGEPLGHPAPLAYWSGRYGDLNPDPLLSLGGDLRAAYWSGSQSFFPMQLDLHAALHPLEHLTLMGTLAARGRVAGLTAVPRSEPSPVFARNAFLMVHELPYTAWARAGLFVPSFGTYLDDHTSFIRRYLEQDISQPESSVLGVELGLAPNYPFASASFFHNLRSAAAPDTEDPGFGGALQLGWRDLAYHVSAHGLLKRRPASQGGDLEAAGVAFGLNPFAWSNDLPLTWLGELTLARRPATGGGRRATLLALYQELWAQLWNGVALRAKYDFADPDLEVAAQVEHRLALFAEISPLPGLTFTGGPRLLWGSDRPAAPDLFIQAHVWF